ncbi:hypothetical protein [Streptomyces xiamenensis]|nr:hypothetical protein [Streptomyces xiamenensis]
MADAPMAQREAAAGLAAFTGELRRITAALDPAAGWYAAFSRRCPEELAGWLAGRELPPWDVVADLLQDLAVRSGTDTAERTGGRLRARYESAVRALDALPGGRAALERALAAADTARRAAAGRSAQLSDALHLARRVGQSGEEERLAAQRLWARDDEHRARAREAELLSRLAALPAPRPATAAPGTSGTPVVRARKRPPRGARFAGIEAEDEVVVPSPPAAGDTVEPPAAPPGGSRFAGALHESRQERRQRLTEEDRQAALAMAARLAELRAAGASGPAHIVLSEAVGGPAARLPVMLEALAHMGLASDVATLLWEAASLPPGPLAAVAEALAGAGRERDCAALLRQAAARPAAEAGVIAAELWRAGRSEEAVTLLTALVGARSAEEAAGAALSSPEVVVPLLVTAAQALSPRHHYAITSELRRANLA